MNIVCDIVREKPATLPIPLETIKLHCRVDDDKDDDVLNIYAWGAIQQGEFLTNRVWSESLFTRTIDKFPRHTFPRHMDVITRHTGTIDKFPRHTDEITITKSPCTKVNKIEYVDPAGDTQVLDPGKYSFTGTSLEWEKSNRPYAVVSPVTRWPRGRNVTIDFLAGFPAGQLPEDLVQWAIITIAGKFDQRESLASASRKIAVSMPRVFHDGLLDRWYLPRW